MIRILVSALFLLFAATTPVRAINELLPPFGFRWGDPPRRVEAVLNGAKAKIVDKKQDGSRSIWTVEGLVHPGLQRTLFTFKNDKLMEVELQYEYPDWSIERYNEQMGTVRRYFDGKYGVGKLVSRSRDTDTDIVHTLVAVLMTLVILMQRPKSEGLGAAFGGGVTENIFGAQTTNVLTKFTGWLAGIFFVLTFVLGILYARRSASDSSLHRELMGMPAATPAASVAPATGLPETTPAASAANVSP